MSLPQRGFSIVLALLVCACSPAPEHARYTVEDYRANADLRHAQVARCQSDPGTLKRTPDCINAQQAAAFEDRVRLRDLPPIGLDPKRNPSGPRSNSEPSAQPSQGETR
jgi:hypothetical protein